MKVGQALIIRVRLRMQHHVGQSMGQVGRGKLSRPSPPNSCRASRVRSPWPLRAGELGCFRACHLLLVLYNCLLLPLLHGPAVPPSGAVSQPRPAAAGGGQGRSHRLDWHPHCACPFHLQRGTAYPCFCSKERLQSLGRTGYDGLCRQLPRQLTLERMKQGHAHTIRLQVCPLPHL